MTEERSAPSLLDDVGIDQFQKTFGLGAENAAPTPAMDTLASDGIRLRNVWAMSECSPSRALMLPLARARRALM